MDTRQKLQTALFTVGGLAVAGIAGWGVYDHNNDPEVLKAKELSRIAVEQQDRKAVSRCGQHHARGGIAAQSMRTHFSINGQPYSCRVEVFNEELGSKITVTRELTEGERAMNLHRGRLQREEPVVVGVLRPSA